MSYVSRTYTENCSSKGSFKGTKTPKSKSVYENATPKVNTGYHIGKLHQDLELAHKNFRLRQDEIFSRIKISLLVSLIAEFAFLEHETEKSGGNLQKTLICNPLTFSLPSNQYLDNVHSLMRNEVETPVLPQARKHRKPYLLLDVRDADEFRASHILTSENYPKSMLSKAKYETAALTAYKNDANDIIVVYDYDETVAPQVATTLIERGYNNVFLLSGGLKVAEQCFPHSLVVCDNVPSISVETAKILTTLLHQMNLKYKK